MEIKTDCFTSSAPIEAGIKAALEEHQNTINDWKNKILNMEKIDKAIEILQAFKEGKRVDFKLKEDSSDNWTPAWNLSKDERMNFSRYDFKIYEEPIYRPYANAEEVIKASKEHGPYVCEKNSEEYYIPLSVDNVGVYVSTMYDRRELLPFDCLFKDFNWQDDTPCGILE